ncbi:VOC family protein [Leptolyngbya sp. AN02str]|uniref:VOC family protein n=1 Tax=Leptolyngbya sp. AN02str TaxID=3423363 RepID=UPI003D3153ED
MHITQIDHLVLTVQDISATCDFYGRVLGMQVVTFGQGRTALVFGQQKINLHLYRQEFEPKARHPTPGSADLCFITHLTLEEAIAHVQHCGVAIEEGIVERTGATGRIRSIYFRDPDGNLLELSNYFESQ